jgi:trk/ktr system potassium uptake protein
MHEAFGSQVVSSTSWGAQRIEQLLLHGSAPSVLTAGHGEVEVHELVVPAAWAGRPLSLLVGEGSVAVALTRGGRASLPGSDTALEHGDVLHVGASVEGWAALRRRLDPRSE